jgi:hypothetical protein
MAARLRRTEVGSFACDALAHGSQLVVVRTRFEAPRPHTARLPARGLPALVVQLGGEQVYTGGGLVRPVAAGDVLFDDGRLPYRRLTLPGAVADALQFLPATAPAITLPGRLLPAINSTVPAVGWLVEQVLRRPGRDETETLGLELIRVVTDLLAGDGRNSSLARVRGRVQDLLEQRQAIRRVIGVAPV